MCSGERTCTIHPQGGPSGRRLYFVDFDVCTHAMPDDQAESGFTNVLLRLLYLLGCLLARQIDRPKQAVTEKHE